MASPITALPTPPSKSTAASVSAFNIQADAFMVALPVFVTETNLLAIDLYNLTGSIGTSDTSTTSLTIGTGSKGPITVGATLNWYVGQRVVIARTSAPTTTAMYGAIAAYSGTSLTVTVDVVAGSGGPFNDWTISLSASTVQIGTAGINDITDCASDATSVFVGSGSGAVDDGTANQNVGLGIDSLNVATSGDNNTAVGYKSAESLSTGTGHVAIGSNTLSSCVSGTNNVAVGLNALDVYLGSTTVAIGANVGGALTSGSSNVLIGTNAGSNKTGGQNNIIIGANTVAPTPGNNYEVALGHQIKAKSADTGTGIEMEIGGGTLYNRTFNIEGGSSTAHAALGAWRRSSTTTNAVVEFLSDHGGTSTIVHKFMVDGDIETYTGSSITTISDRKTKENVIPATPKLGDVLKLNVVNFRSKILPNVKQIGMIAQEVEDVFPSLVKTSPDTKNIEVGGKTEVLETGDHTKSIRFNPFMFILIKALQEEAALRQQISVDLASAIQRIEQLESKEQQP